MSQLQSSQSLPSNQSGPSTPSTDLRHLTLTPLPRVHVPLMFLYRANPTFERILPTAEQLLRKEGVDVVRVPVVTTDSVSEIQEKLRLLSPEMSKRVVVADRTISKLLPNDVASKLRWNVRAAELDQIVAAATHRTLSGAVGFSSLDGYRNLCFHHDSAEGYRNYLHGALETMERLLKVALSGKPVGQVLVFPQHLDEHIPFCAGPGTDNSEQYLVEVLARAGVASDRIVVIRKFEDIDIDSLRDCELSVCIGDRHILTTSTIDRGLRALVSSWVGGSRILDGRNILERRPKGFDSQKRQLIEAGIAEQRELLGLSDPLFGADSSRRVWLSLPLEELFGSVVSSGLVNPGSIGSPGEFDSVLLNTILERFSSLRPIS